MLTNVKTTQGALAEPREATPRVPGPICMSHRFEIALLGLTIAVVNCYAQATFYIAIVEMVYPADLLVQTSNQSATTINAGQRPPDTASIHQSCPIEWRYRDYYDDWRRVSLERNVSLAANSPIGSQTKPIDDAASLDLSNRFNWDASRQGLLLGAFSIGMSPLQVFGGRLAEIYGAKWVLLAGCLGTGITNLAGPWLSHLNFTLLLLSRVIMGVTQAGMEPGLMCLLAEWLTPDETSFFISMLLFAMSLGFFLGTLVPGFILTLGFGWPTTYYLSGGLNLAIGLVWVFYASSRPRESHLISAHELELIEKSKQQQHSQHFTESTTSPSSSISNIKPSSNKFENADLSQHISAPPTTPRAPWRRLLSTRSVWAFMVCKLSIRWASDVMSIEFPSYLASVLHLSIKLNGILNSVSCALFALMSFAIGCLVNELLKRRGQFEAAKSGSKDEDMNGPGPRCFLITISKTNFRKFFQSIASFGSAASLLAMTHFDCNIPVSMCMMLVLSCCLVIGVGGELQIPYDMTSRYPGTLHGLACSLSVSGWFAPLLIGFILGDQPSSRARWSLVWHLAATLNIIGGLVFVLWADASPRDFDAPSKDRPTSDRPRWWRPVLGARQKYNPNLIHCRRGDAARDSLGKRDGPNGRLAAGNQQNWAPHFDRTLIKCRQLPEATAGLYGGLSPPSYFILDSVASYSPVMPYKAKLAPAERAPNGQSHGPHRWWQPNSWLGPQTNANRELSGLGCGEAVAAVGAYGARVGSGGQRRGTSAGGHVGAAISEQHMQPSKTITHL